MNMKNKQSKEDAARKKHIEQRKAAKIRRTRQPLLDRSPPSRLLRPVILLVCEGVNTEVSYFKHFRLSSARIKAIGKGFNTISLVKEALRLQKEGSFEQVWVVFDKDDNSDEYFNEAMFLAEKKGLRVAYSNQAFEYWFLLHFTDHQGGCMNRCDYHPELKKHLQPLKVVYEGSGSKIVTPALFDVLEGTERKYCKSRRQLAEQRAERVWNNCRHLLPARQESVTTVFRLTKEISKYFGR